MTTTNTKTGEAGLKVSTTCSHCEGSGSDELGRCMACKGEGFADQSIESLMLEVALERSSHNITCLRLTAAEEFIERLVADGVLTKEEIRRWDEIKARKYRAAETTHGRAPRIIQLLQATHNQWNYEGQELYREYRLLGLDDQGAVWCRGENGWEPHTAALAAVGRCEVSR